MQLSQCVVLVAALCLIPSALAILEPDPCLTKACNPDTEVCRELETCYSRRQCSRRAVCLPKRESRFLSGGCRIGEPLLERNASGSYELRVCYNDYNCDEGFYCSYELQDVSSRCCRANPVPEVRRGSCPAPEARDSMLCVDACRSDADCYGNMKCCQDTRSCPRKVCTSPDPCSLKNCPRGTDCVVDPNYNAHCLVIPNEAPVTQRPSPPVLSPIWVSFDRCPHMLYPVRWDTDCANHNHCGHRRACGPRKTCCPSYYCGVFICRTPVQ